MRSVKGYGWKRDLPDHRDLRLAPPNNLASLPTAVDLRPSCPPVYDQGDLGSCTANGIAFLFEFETKRQKLPDFMPSRLFIYFNERLKEGDTGSDNGASPRDGMDSIHSQGVCPETLWPYIENQFSVQPPKAAYDQAKLNVVSQYLSLQQDPGHLKACLAEGFPFGLGISVFESFESDAVAASGIVPMPDPKESCLGGHFIACVGYDDAKEAFLCRNSWGNGWGLAGYFWLPYDYVLDNGLASDFWTIRTVD